MMKEKTKNIVTFGAHNRVKVEQEKLDSTKSKWENRCYIMDRKKREIKTLLLNVIAIKKNALKSLPKITRITKNIRGKEREFIEQKVENEKLNIDFDAIENTLSFADITHNTSKGAAGGIGAGLLTSSAVPFLVGQLASASTGTAISSLSGARQQLMQH